MDLAIATAIFGTALVALILWEGFETIIMPRRVTRRLHLSRYFVLLSWRIWKAASRLLAARRQQEEWLSFFGPLSIPLMLIVWVTGLITGCALLYWSSVAILGPQGAGNRLLACFYLSGTTFFTLGLGDVVPANRFSRLLAVLESGMGFGFLALMIAYLPSLNQSFSRREANILLLDARAGSPPSAAEILRRHSDEPGLNALREHLKEWEYWSAELLESHLSYPVLAYFRSQHDNVSWLGSLATILDTCAFLMVALEGICERQAELTFAIARHAVVDLSLAFRRAPQEMKKDRLPPETLAHLRTLLTEAGLKIKEGEEVNGKLAELRQMYEPYLNGLSTYFLIDIPPWIVSEKKKDNWQVSAWEPRGGLFRTGRTRTEKKAHW